MRRKSIWSVLAGVFFIIIVTTIIDIIFHLVRVFPPVGKPMSNRLALLAVSYRIIISIFGAFLTARLAPARPMKHALILGMVGTILGFIGVVATWNLGLGPRWYSITLAILAMPQCWVGGRVYETLKRKQ